MATGGIGNGTSGNSVPGCGVLGALPGMGLGAMSASIYSSGRSGDANGASVQPDQAVDWLFPRGKRRWRRPEEVYQHPPLGSFIANSVDSCLQPPVWLLLGRVCIGCLGFFSASRPTPHQPT